MSSRTFSVQPVKVIVMELLSKKDSKEVSKDDLILEIIRLQKSTRQKAEDFFNGMVILGLNVCKVNSVEGLEGPFDHFSIPKFAYMRNFITKEQYAKLIGKRSQDL